MKLHPCSATYQVGGFGLREPPSGAGGATTRGPLTSPPRAGTIRLALPTVRREAHVQRTEVGTEFLGIQKSPTYLPHQEGPSPDAEMLTWR